MSHHNYNYNNPARSSRPSHSSGDSHSGSFLEQGRTILPPLTIAFPTSDSPGSSFHVTSTHVNSTLASFDTGPGNYYPTTQQRSTPVSSYEQTYCAYFDHPPAQQQAGYAQASYHSYQQPPDARYLSGQTYGSYNRASPSSSSPDPRRLRPLSVPRDDRGQSSQYYQQPHTDLQMPTATSDMRSPHAVYSPATTTEYPQYQYISHASAYPPNSNRGSIPAAAATHSHYHQSMPTGHSSVDRTMAGSRNITQLPYARNAPPAMSPVDYEPPSDAAEPTIKKKRKRADARQLEVLNATYNRTAFPSTEERAALAKQLDMSARSVQIWFQNKRQAMRQGGRATTSTPNPLSNPGPAPVPTPTPPVAGYHRASPALMSPMVQQSGPAYSSRSPPPMVRTGQTPSPPSGRSRADIDPRTGRHWPGPNRGY
ncbi:homeobox-domain-containing protein [Lactarius pseudohatsudake]|nr:homeobox-domain-containing protein [Lactarius pseudohatsudake]